MGKVQPKRFLGQCTLPQISFDEENNSANRINICIIFNEKCSDIE
jgi:hypothetical protein